MRCIFFTFSNSFPIFQYKTFFPYKHSFFFLSGFSSQTLTIHRTATLHSTRSRTLRHLLATLHVRWISRIFNRNACVYQTATRWDLPPYRITIWVINWWCNVCLFTWWIDAKVFFAAIWHSKPVDLNSHRLSPLYYKWTD